MVICWAKNLNFYLIWFLFFGSCCSITPLICGFWLLIWFLLMLGDLTSSFFSFSFRSCWCMGTISQKSFSWFYCYFGICHLISWSSSIFSTMVLRQLDAQGFDVQKVFFLLICSSVNAWEYNFQAISFVWFCSCIWHFLSFVNAFLIFWGFY